MKGFNNKMGSLGSEEVLDESDLPKIQFLGTVERCGNVTYQLKKYGMP